MITSVARRPVNQENFGISLNKNVMEIREKTVEIKYVSVKRRVAKKNISSLSKIENGNNRPAENFREI